MLTDQFDTLIALLLFMALIQMCMLVCAVVIYNKVCQMIKEPHIITLSDVKVKRDEMSSIFDDPYTAAWEGDPDPNKRINTMRDK